jgi:glutathione S-transferase
MTSRMIVHGVPGSPYVRAVLLTLEEKGADYELAAMQLGSLKQEPHLSRHPFGRIPAFEHDGWMLYETQAIIRYVDSVAPGPRLQPEDPRAAARMNQLMGIADWYLMPQASRTITFNRVVAPRFGRPTDEDAVMRAVPEARICIAEIGRLLGGAPWMAGDALSLADLLLAPQLSMFALAPEGAEILRDHANLTGWLQRIEARPSMAATAWEKLLERAAAAA